MALSVNTSVAIAVPNQSHVIEHYSQINNLSGSETTLNATKANCFTLEAYVASFGHLFTVWCVYSLEVYFGWHL